MLFALLRTQSDQEHDADEETQTALAARHDPDAFVDLYHRYLDPIYRYCHRRLNTVDAAEDATSQVFERALRSIHQYRGGSFRAWLFRIAYTTVVDTWKRPTPVTSDIDPDIKDPEPTPEQRAIQREGGENVQELLEQLTEEQARVIELRLAGLKGPEIAEAMDRSPESVRMLQHRGIARLRRYLEDEQPLEADDGSA